MAETWLDQSEQLLRWSSGFRLFFGTTVTHSLEIKNNLSKSSVKAEKKTPKSSKKAKDFIHFCSSPIFRNNAVDKKRRKINQNEHLNNFKNLSGLLSLFLQVILVL